jgi:tryptophan halogenase
MEKINRVSHVAIVGGGTSAWLTAALLSNKNKDLYITIIDKEVGNPVGVGEGTLLSFDKVMANAGFEFCEWFREIDATAKSGILFPSWGKNKEAVWHPFMFAEFPDQETTLHNCWSKTQQYDFRKYATSYYDVSMNHDKVDVTALDGYAFHIDAGKLVTFIQKKLANRLRVTSIKSDVIEVFRDTETHNVTELVLKNGQHISADLYVDCTGFKAILNLKPDRVTLENRLFCDTAIAGHVPYEDIEAERHPYVISEQVEHGWVWNIPVQSRIGSGLVFNRSVTDPEDAKDFFVNYWNGRVKKENLKVIDWTPYYNNNMWHENVCAIGLSAGFIEPLESTGVALIIAGIEQLSFAITPRGYTETHKESFNKIMKGYFEDCIDFVSMHYENVERDEPFWKWVKETWVKSDRQQHLEEQILRTDCMLPVQGFGYMFSVSNWICWFMQLGKKMNPSQDGLSKEQAESLVVSWKDFEDSRVSRSISHTEYIEASNNPPR